VNSVNGKSLWLLLLLFGFSCSDMGEEQTVPPAISSDGELFHHITQADPFPRFHLFPRADSVTSGTLNGSAAHQPLVSVGLNSLAFSALDDGALPAGSLFPDGSIIVKRILAGDSTVLIAVMYKALNHPLSGEGWLWAEFRPDGTPFLSMERRGVNCIGCHAREQGTVHDRVRTFERQYR
jgi:hypothetical protein